MQLPPLDNIKLYQMKWLESGLQCVCTIFTVQLLRSKRLIKSILLAFQFGIYKLLIMSHQMIFRLQQKREQ